MPEFIERGSRGDQTTGRMLVLLADDSAADGGLRALSDAGIKLVSAASFDGAVPASAWDDNDGVLFDELGIALLSNRPGTAAVTRASALITSAPEPERYKHATALLDDATRDYLRGYKDGVDQLVEKLLNQQPAPSPEDAGASAVGSTWGIKDIGALASTFSGKGIKVCVLDTGIDLNHPDFKGRTIVSKSFIPGVTSVQDGHGHGTHTAGTACGPKTSSKGRYGVAYEADLYIGKVLGDDGGGQDGWILSGINWAVRNGCRVISMSLGSAGTPPSPAYEQAASRARKKGTIIIAAAGNESERPGLIAKVDSPANCVSIMAVAAVDRSHKVGWFSCGADPSIKGAEVDVAGPGLGVLSSYKGGGYTSLNGTSMATPHVAGVAALLMQANPTADVGKIWSLITQTATTLPAPPSDVGAGLVHAP